MARLIPIAFVALGCGSLLACGDESTYELRWTLGCESGLGPCEITSARDCTRVGVGHIEVEALQGTNRTRTVMLCFGAPDGAVGRGPGLSAGAVELTVWPLSAGARRLPVEPATVSGEIPTSGVVELRVDVPVAPACSDGVDNDGDDHVDLFDPECESDTDVDEAT
jgi:hypothetical protein